MYYYRDVILNNSPISNPEALYILCNLASVLQLIRIEMYIVQIYASHSLPRM